MEQNPLSKEIQYLGQQVTERQNNTQETTHQSTKEVLGVYARSEAREFLHETQVLPQHETERLVLKLKPEDHDKKIEGLFSLVLEKGVKNALDVVRNMNDPHLEDDFHRFLVQYLHTIKAIPGLKEETQLKDSLSNTLFAITLPYQKTENGSVDFKKFIQAMKQFLSGMISTTKDTRREYYTLEIAVENKGQDIGIYAAIPSGHVEIFEKLIHAYYPNASVEEVTDDYNLFSSRGGAIVGSVLGETEPIIFPLNTDEHFEHDPMSALIGSISRLEKEDEGAAIQIVIGHLPNNSLKYFESIIDASEKNGKKLKEQFEISHESLIKGVGKGLLSFFEKEKTQEEKDQEQKIIDTKGIELGRKKLQSQLFDVNIRIITSAPTLQRATQILQTIKSSFTQFNLTGSNNIIWKDIKISKLPDFIKDFIFRNFDHNEILILNIDELSTLFHLPVGLLATPDLKNAESNTAPIPSTMSANGITLGTNNYRGTPSPVYFAREDRVRHCYVIGQTGTGKTVFLKNMIIQDIKNGEGVCFIDPHGNDIEDILANIPPERIDDVIYFDPAYVDRPMGLNMLEYDPRYPEQKIFVINELLAIFNKLFDMKVSGGPMFEQYFRNSAGLVMEHPESGSTLLEIGRVLTDKPFRDLKLSHCKNPIIKQFWENAEKTTGESALANFVPYITNKFDVFISNDIMRPVIAQQKSVFNFRDIMDNKKILLVNLSKGRLGDINSHLIGLLLVGKITMAALSRVDIVGRGVVNDFYLYIDEFQNITTDSISTILSEARKYRLSLTIAHQYIEQLDEGIKNAVFGNVGSMVIHRVSQENAEIFAKQLEPTFKAEDITQLQNLNCYIKMLVNGMPAKPFNSFTPFPSRGNAELAQKIKELSYLKYGRPRDEVDTEILARYK